jgi:DNA-directed RNA polymerase I subunit RPA2
MKLQQQQQQSTGEAPRNIAESCPSFSRGTLPIDEDVEKYRYLTRPHVESFNYFLEAGLAKGIKDLEPAEIDVIDPKTLREEHLRKTIDWDEVSTIRFWVEDVKIHKPTQADRGRSNQRLLPHECRERSLTYAGEITGKFCYQIVQRRNGVDMKGTPNRLPKTFGKLPIMVGTKACYLEGMTSKQLSEINEEVCTKVPPKCSMTCTTTESRDT